jgi:hypothetical protein
MGDVVFLDFQPKQSEPDILFGFKQISRYWWFGQADGAAFFARTAIELAGKYVAWLIESHDLDQIQEGCRNPIDRLQFVENLASQMVIAAQARRAASNE